MTTSIIILGIVGMLFMLGVISIQMAAGREYGILGSGAHAIAVLACFILCALLGLAALSNIAATPF
jgi:hypothetical protein